MRVRVRLRYLWFVALAGVALLAACSSAKEQEAPTSAPSATPEPVFASCGSSGPNQAEAPLTAISPQRDGYIWVLPDGSDASLDLDDIRASDPDASESTAMSFPPWSTPAVSPDGLRSAMTVLRRYSGSSDTRTMIVLSTTNDPVLATLVLPEGYVQALVTLSWLPESGCLAVLVFEPSQAQQLYILRRDGQVAAQFQPKLGRGTLLDASGSGWVALDRLTWAIPEVELFNLQNPGTTIVVGAGERIPNFPGLPGNGMTAEQFVTSLRS